MNRLVSRPLLLALLLVPLAAAAQDMRMRGTFNLLRAAAADTRPPSGEARATIDADGAVRIDLVVSGLDERVTGATLHPGDAGENTERVARMDVSVDGNEARLIGGRAELTPIVARRVRENGAYILLHTSEHPDGYLRAQLAPQATAVGSVVSGP
ncbi:CHRD domain-containing protein [Lysobacter xanthus]